MRHLTKCVAVLAAALSTTLLAACVPAAGFFGDGGRTVHVYSVAAPSQNKRLEDAFNASHPEITLEITRGASDLVPKVDAEIATGADGADIFIMSGDSWFLRNKDNLAPVTADAAKTYPDWGVDGHAPIVSYSPFSMILWNTDAFPDGFETWDDLLAPEVKNRLGVRDTMSAVLASYLQYLQDKNGPNYLSELAEQNPKFYPSLIPMAQAVASGEIGVAYTASPAVVHDLESRGAPIDSVLIKDGWASPFIAGILKKSPRQDDAQIVMDYLLSPAGQEVFNGSGDAGSPIEGLNGTIDTSHMRVLSEKDTPAKVIAEWAVRLREIFNRG
ncbi:iron(III) transport system substrate-binding protein [Rhodococcus percolatus]|uniref:Extracellular solute-binding protein n=1 Tax=Rhodococcus opacus TaxID=37919 RepID=A0AAX3Y517_RHOOP|nr:extracellular solute-binding protein [Rhodococcus opacus]MBA8963762.1 iron(III) transport system substrate-binding protein [Rhodococcus opacus]MBP2207252.1 iron(III) transport system substrate-binding protein [Rhodococcus opacus]MCZ4588262.1 extracellular solute-binding protein [Rhodococcus opacus]WLF44387.1 extracellular solute-binding protein [Rhodococcus opacus]